MRLLIFISVALLVVGCSSKNQLDDGTQFKLITIGDEQDTPRDLVTISLSPTVRPYYPTFPITISIQDFNNESALDRKVLSLYPGDSIEFVTGLEAVKSSVLYGYMQEQFADTIRLKILGHYSFDEHSKLLESQADSLERLESVTIQNWVADNLDTLLSYDQIFLAAWDSSGRSGGQVACDSIVMVNYTGSLFTGREFDGSETGGFKYKVCEPGQLIKGLQQVVGWMSYGDKLKIILPSQLAFGPVGSANGAVPPFTPVIYEIQINKE